MKNSEFEAIAKSVLPLISDKGITTSLLPNFKIVIEAFYNSRILDALAKLYRAHLSFHQRGGFLEAPESDPFRARPYPPEAFIENMVKSFSGPIDREPRPPNEWDRELEAQVKRVRKLQEITKRSELLSLDITVAEILYANHVIPSNLDISNNPGISFALNSAQHVGSIDNILDLYVEYLENSKGDARPYTADKLALLVYVSTRRLFELTGKQKNTAVIDIINSIHACQKSYDFGKRHMYKP